MQEAFITQHHARAPLILERNLADFKAAASAEFLAQFAEGRTDHGDLRIGEYDRNRAAAQA
ncbi:hypothetical protein D3C73_1592770 [compost metagenome]